MRRFLALAALLWIGGALPAADLPAPTDDQKIEGLLTHIAAQKDLKFIRNGSAYDSVTAVKFLRGKWDRQKAEIKTANDFIEKVGSKSSTTGQPYLIRLSDGKEIACRDYLLARLNPSSEVGTLENQLRGDITALVRAKTSPSAQTDVQAQEKIIDQMTADVKRLFPSVLAEAMKSDPPTDEALTRALEELNRIGAGAPRPVMISFYTELWETERIGQQQRILFERLARAIAKATIANRN